MKSLGITKLLIALLSLITVSAVGVTLWAVFIRDRQPVLAPDYVPVEQETHAEAIPGDTGEKMESGKGGGSVSLSYSDEATIDLSDRQATVMFANPGKSNQDMVLQVVIQDTVIIQSGTLSPGNRVTTLDLLPGAEKQLVPGGYEGKYVVFYYDETTGEKAMVNTEIPISITIAE